MTSYLLTTHPWLLDKVKKHGSWCVYDLSTHLWFKVRLEGRIVQTSIIGKTLENWK